MKKKRNVYRTVSHTILAYKVYFFCIISMYLLFYFWYAAGYI